MYAYLLLLVGIIFISSNMVYGETYSQSSDFKCNSSIDNNGDGIPDKIESKRSINWSYCNLEGQDISKIKSFDYADSVRPFDKNGIPYDSHEQELDKQPDRDYYDRERTENAHKESFIEKIIRNIYELFGQEHDKYDKIGRAHV